MIDHVTFRTPGELNPTAFMTFGVSAKPGTDSPIGYFGTGLKYAIAVLLRHGAEFRIDIGKDRWIFGVDERDFRGTKINQVVYTINGKPTGELPFTTDLGKNWEIWQAYRELESNTRDEAGNCTLGPLGYPRENETVIYVLHSKMTKLFNMMGAIFLDPNIGKRAESNGVEIYSASSKYLYYRGIRCMTLPRPGLYTYNITGFMSLTEDRTPASENSVCNTIAGAIMNLNDPDLIEIMIRADEEKYFEGKLPYDNHYSCSDAFSKSVDDIVSNDGFVVARAKTFHNRYLIDKSDQRRVVLLMTEAEWREIWSLVEGEPNAAVDAFKSQLSLENIRV